MKWKTLGTLALWVLPLFVFSGCTTAYRTNRVADFSDIFLFGAGVTTENPVTGMWPPTLGLYIQATEFINLGAITFHGVSAEWDGRGFYAGPEGRTRLGILSYQELQINQDYAQGCENYFKKANTLWSDRMNASSMRWKNKPAKELEYDFWALTRRRGSPIMHRGWHYWETFGFEVGIPEPFLTHAGITLRAGFDSESYVRDVARIGLYAAVWGLLSPPRIRTFLDEASRAAWADAAAAASGRRALGEALDALVRGRGLPALAG